MTFCNQINVQVLIELLKQSDINTCIISPGMTNCLFVSQIQDDPFFKCYSCIDERSASYMAVGMSRILNKPVFVSCTGATASRNYVPGATEAFYSNAKVLYITSDYGGEKGMNIPQQIDRSQIQKDIAKKSYLIEGDLQTCRRRISEGLNELNKDEGGPVHFNLKTYSNTTKENISTTLIKYYNIFSDFPDLSEFKRINIIFEKHVSLTPEQINIINIFCERYNAVFLKNLNNHVDGLKYSIDYCKIVKHGHSKLLQADLTLYFGGPYSEYLINAIPKTTLWKIGKDNGKFIDPYSNLDKVFDVDFLEFFKKYIGQAHISKNLEYYDELKKQETRLYSQNLNNNIPFSNIYIASKFSKTIVDNSIVYLSILNTYRSWNFFQANKTCQYLTNTGGYGIDGIMSTCIGSSIVSDKLHYCFIGDSAFFYDMNSLGNKHIKNNIRICVINNGGCAEFKTPGHKCREFQYCKNYNDIMLAKNHWGNQSKTLIKAFSESLGFKYFSAAGKDEFDNIFNELNARHSDYPILLECFMSIDDDAKALEII